jgi:hypothetical protein
MIRKCILGLAAAGAILGVTATSTLAASTSPATLAQVTIQKSGTKNYVVESLVFVALVGTAIFVICKSSRRV